MLATLPAALAAQTSRSPKASRLPAVGEFVRFSDPTTETFVVRLTSLKSAAYLPAAQNRIVSVKERFLLFCSDRNGALSPFQVDLRTGAVRHLANTANLTVNSLCLDAKEHWAYFLDGGRVMRAEAGKKDERRREAEKVIDGGVSNFSLAGGDSIFFISDGTLQRWEEGGKTNVLYATSGATACHAQPGGPTSGCLYTRDAARDEREFWYLGAAADSKPMLLAEGKVSDPFWSPDGQSILFLREVARNEVILSEIHSVGLDGKPEQCVAPTSQFASFAPNFDASVFVGASRSKAQPNIVLLLRSAKREMTLCQHHASRPSAVLPVFSADARRVYFQSDQDGKSAVYSVNVESLVEPATDNTGS